MERLQHPEYWQSMILASARAWRQAGTARPVGLLMGWTVWALDGKAYLFRDDRDYCRRCDWFYFCALMRAWFKE